MKFLLIMFCLFTHNAMGSIFDGDDRKDFYEIKDKKMASLSESFPTLILKDKIQKLSNGDYKIVAKSLHKGYNFCSSTKFSDQPQASNCSASLVSKNQILTAAHCISQDSGNTFSIDNYLVVFDYKKTSLLQTEYIIPQENVFEIQKIQHYEFSWETMLDLAILKLSRSTTRRAIEIDFNYSPRKADGLFVLGYPLGIPQKLADNGYVTLSNRQSKNSFTHNLDTFSCNSGSGIIDAKSHKIVGVHVRGTGSNYKKYGRDCYDWFIADPSIDFGEANTLNSLKGLFNSL